ncbi:MAG: hypothetical protein COT14_02510 [Candidatus Diapherotrites archaeon CG08_land_8_20_14_0_20_30_16]|nr:MAG: hypothetical protein COT14_02510 [Candidatus Diapherotrites archaeon CG08_land_8_20_14_0_20_30_16]
MYSKKVIETFKNPKHAGKIKDADAIGCVGNIKCGDKIQVFLKVKNNKIEDIKFQTYGCPAAISASDTMCKLVKGKTLEKAEKLTYKNIIDELGQMPKIKYHCSIMGTEALHNAILNYRESHKNKKDNGDDKMNFTKKTTLGKVLNAKKGPELLGKYHVPCLGCHFASQELDQLTLQDISNAYGIDLKGLLKDLNNSFLKKESNSKVEKNKFKKAKTKKTKEKKK